MEANRSAHPRVLVKNSLLEVICCSFRILRALRERGFCDLMWGCSRRLMWGKQWLAMKRGEASMACASVAFTDPGGLAGARFPSVSKLNADQFYFEPEISSAHCFEGIVGKSQALLRVLQQVEIVAPTNSTVLLH